MAAAVLRGPRPAGARLRPALIEAIETSVTKGLPASTAATLAGVPPQTWSLWMAIAEGRLIAWPDGRNINPEFRVWLTALGERITAARAVFEAKMVANITAAAENVNSKTGIGEWRAAGWLLNNHPAYRREYHEYRETHATTKTVIDLTVRRQVEAMDLPDVIDLAGPEFAAMLPAQAAHQHD